jgi:uncharacterized protein (TIGR02246 family)
MVETRTSISDDERAIRDLVDTWMAASEAGDTETVLGLIDDDALFTVAGREPFGKDEFRAHSEAMTGVDVDGRAEVREIEVLGDWAWIRNHIDLMVTAPGREPKHRAGYTLTILRKGADGRWRLYRDANLVS